MKERHIPEDPNPHPNYYERSSADSPVQHTAHFRQECHNSKFGIFELLVQKETPADALLTGIVS
jgi:hypothetical protein